jgi:hypothetical protein
MAQQAKQFKQKIKTELSNIHLSVYTPNLLVYLNRKFMQDFIKAYPISIIKKDNKIELKLNVIDYFPTKNMVLDMNFTAYKNKTYHLDNISLSVHNRGNPQIEHNKYAMFIMKNM